MRFSVLTVAALASAGVAHAGVIDLLEGRQADGCQYVKASYLSTCTAGDTLFCTGNRNVCVPYGLRPTFDDKATKDNEDECAGRIETSSCIQVVHCCP